jgi:DNA-binding beta-propeller fold protein YncE
VTGLPSSPKVTHTIDVSAGEDLSRMTVSDDGSLVLYSVSQGTHDALFAWTALNGSRMLTTGDSISDIALTPAGDAVVADARSNEIFSITDPKGYASRLFLADDRSGVSNPTSVAVSKGGQIYVANGGSDTIVTLDSAGHVLRVQQCGCELAGLFPLKDSLYRLSDRTDSTLYLLEAGVTGDRVLFVPPSRKNQ